MTLGWLLPLSPHLCQAAWQAGWGTKACLSSCTDSFAEGSSKRCAKNKWTRWNKYWGKISSGNFNDKGFFSSSSWLRNHSLTFFQDNYKLIFFSQVIWIQPPKNFWLFRFVSEQTRPFINNFWTQFFLLLKQYFFHTFPPRRLIAYIASHIHFFLFFSPPGSFLGFDTSAWYVDVWLQVGRKQETPMHGGIYSIEVACRDWKPTVDDAGGLWPSTMSQVVRKYLMVLLLTAQ